jgi:ribosomal protein L11 methyltransferase
MTWWAIDIRTATERRDMLSAWLVAQTGQAVEERDDGTLVTVAPDEASAEALVQRLGRDVDSSAETTRRPLELVDWSIRWRDGLGPRHFGRLTVLPSWLGQASLSGPHTVVLDPETAFGSGEHGSTRIALTLLEQLIKAGDQVIDLGSGSGILAIAAVKLGASRVIAIETDPEAIDVAGRNIARNGVAANVEVLEGDAEFLAPLVGPADLVLSNILRSVNTRLLPAIEAALRPGALAVFSGMEEGEAPDFLRVLNAAGFRAVREAADTGWRGVAVERRR